MYNVCNYIWNVFKHLNDNMRNQIVCIYINMHKKYFNCQFLSSVINIIFSVLFDKYQKLKKQAYHILACFPSILFHFYFSPSVLRIPETFRYASSMHSKKANEIFVMAVTDRANKIILYFFEIMLIYFLYIFLFYFQWEIL